MDIWINIILFVAILAPFFLIITFTPQMTPNIYSFGIRIPENAYNLDEIVLLRKKFRNTHLLFSLLFTIFFISISVYFSNEAAQATGLIICIIGFLIADFFIYLHCHKKMKVLRNNMNWAIEKKQPIVIDTSFRNEKLTYSNGLFSIHAFICFITILITISFYPELPNQIPTKFNWDGTITTYSEKTIGLFSVFPLIQFVTILLFMGINILLKRAKQQLNVQNADASKISSIQSRRKWSLFMIGSSLLSVFLFTLFQISYIVPFSPLKLIISTIIITTITITWAIIIARKPINQGTLSSNENFSIQQDDDHFWKLGQFYYNRNDPTLMLEKRFGLGWTFNFARPIAWGILFGPLVLILGIVLLTA